MQCPECQFDNPDGVKFCGECGNALQLACIHCNSVNPPGFKFCGECGCELSVTLTIKLSNQENVAEVIKAEDHADDATCSAQDSERKCVTVVFSDLTGYTEISEKLDPEEVKEITSTIFSELTKIIEKFDGFIEKYVGDAILAVFGAKEAFEDSALRAIKAAREIHTYVDSVSPKYEELIGRQLSMHTGINTGLVVTGEINYQKGTHGLVGDTINTAARLMSASQPGKIIIDHDSFVQTEGYFEFDPLDPVKVKGKTEPIKVYQVGIALQTPKKLHRLHGLRAELIGRSIEMQALKDAAESLEKGKGSVVSVCGTAGTGKSRLVHEFKKTLDLEKFQWFDGNAYPHTQNTPYYPLVDLLTKAFGIEENDSHDAIKQKIELNIEGLLGNKSGKAPYIAGLFSIKYIETSEVSPEYWKDQLHSAVQEVLKALILRGPTIVCLEDLHWADPSTMELVQKLVSIPSYPFMTICIYRPIITLFTDFEIKGLKNEFTELRLQELSPSESHEMVCSLLKTDEIPKELRNYIRDSIDGNPFYVEELINALIDSESLSRSNGRWVITRDIDESYISTNIQRVVAGRIDRLGYDTKRLLQEASVIGRAFLYDILKRISEIKKDISHNLVMLERLDLIRAKSIQPAIEYIFKHALTQEVVYNGLLRHERREIHERIGLAIEQLFYDRHQEFYEILAYHFKRGSSQIKAAEYLIKAGQKSFTMCAVEEAQNYYQDAYQILSILSEKDKSVNILLVDLLNEWGLTLVWRSASTELIELFMEHLKIAKQIDDKEKLSLFYSNLGIALNFKGNLTEAHTYLQKSLKLAEEAKSPNAIGYAALRLSIVHANIGNLKEAVRLAEKARLMSGDPSADLPLHRLTISLSVAYLYSGNINKLRELGTELLGKLDEKKDLRYFITSKLVFGISHFCAGEYRLAIQNYKSMLEESLDPMLTQSGKLFIGYAYLGDENYQKALILSEEVIRFSEKFGTEYFKTVAMAFHGFALAAAGSLDKGLKLLNNVEKFWLKENYLYSLAVLNCFYGQLYLKIVAGKNPKSLSFIIKNIRPIFKLVPGAKGKSETHFKKAIDITNQIGAKCLLAQAMMGLGYLYRATKRNELAKDCFVEAIKKFEEIDAVGFIEVSKTALESI